MTAILKNTNSRYTILYYEEVDIDGFNCREEFVRLITDTGIKRRYVRAHEFCCGHGAIGFKILENGLIDHLVLTDKYLPASVSCDFTRTVNDLQSLVTIYNTDSICRLPTSEKWDLFIANPPWRSKINPGPELNDDLLRKMWDLDWAVHKNMYQNISTYLTDDADLYIYEDSRFSDRDTWEPYINDAGLKIHNIYYKFGIVSTGYVMHLKKSL